MTIIILKKPMMSSKSSPPTRWWWWRRRHGTASGRHGAIYIHSSIRYTYTALVSSFSSLLLVSNKPLYSWTLTSHWPVWLAARRRISWRHLDDICGLCDTCGQLVMIFVMVMDYMWWLCDICDCCVICGCVIYVCVDAINEKNAKKKANFPAMLSAMTKTLGNAGRLCRVL